MALVSANCPNCGASIQVNNELEKGFCMYCGSQISIQQVIQKVKIDKSDDLANLLKIAEENLTIGHFDAASRQIQKALEIDSCCAMAWLLNMYCISQVYYNSTPQVLSHLSDVNNLNTNQLRQIISSGQNAVKYDTSKMGYAQKVNDTYLIIIRSYIQTASEIVSDAKNKEVKKLYDNAPILDDEARKTHRKHIKEKDWPNILFCKNIEIFLESISKEIDKSLIDENIHTTIELIIKDYIEYISLINSRIAIYTFWSFDREDVSRRKSFIAEFKGMLPIEKSSIIEGGESGNNKLKPEDIVICIAYIIIIWFIIHWLFS